MGIYKKDTQEKLMQQIQQLSGMLAQQKSFRQQMELLQQTGNNNPEPKKVPEKKLTNQLANFFKNM